MKILHLADLHIRDKDIEEIVRCLGFIITTAHEEKPDLAIIAGDIFDSQDVKVNSHSARSAMSFVSALADVCPVAIVLGTPSHDGKAPEITRYVRGKYDVLVADHPMQAHLEDGGLFDRPAGDKIPEAILTLIPQPTKQFFQTASGIEGADREIGQAMSGMFAGFGAQAAAYPGVLHVLVYHGCISGGQASSGQLMTGRDIEVSRDQLEMTGADLILCGHLHLPQELPGNIFYSGSIYANNIGEDHKHGFYVHEVAA